MGPDGQPIDRSKLTGEIAGPTVTGVRSVLTGHPAEGLTPLRLGHILREAESGDPIRYLELAEQMEEKDLHYRSVLGTRKNLVAGLDVTVEAASDDRRDVEIADFLRAWIARQELQDELFDVLDAVGKGFSATEIVWDTSAGQWLPLRLEWRDPRWFQFDLVDGRRPLLRTEAGPRPLDPYRFITHVHKSKSGLPIRGGLARPVTWAYLFKNFDVKSWMTFAEGYGRPLRLGKFDRGASERDKAILLSAVRQIASDAAAIIPAEMEIQFVEAKLTGNLELFERIADWFDRQVSKAVLGQTGTTDVGQHVGTANAHEKVREDIEASDARQLAVTLNRDLVRPIVDLNFGVQAQYPVLRVYRPDPDDTDGLVARVEKLVPLGLRVEESWMRDKLGIPDPDQGATLLTPATAATTTSPALARALTTAQPAPVDTGDAIDALVAEALGDWRPSMAPMIEPIQKLLLECRSYEEFLRRLPEIADRMDPTALTEALARAAFVARLAGETEADLGQG